MQVTILPSTGLTAEDLQKYQRPVIIYGPETIHEMLSKYPTADGYIVELGARIYIKQSSPVTLPRLVKHKDFYTSRARTLTNTAFDLRAHPGRNILRMTPSEISRELNIKTPDAVKMKYREHSTIIIGTVPAEYDKLLYWKLDEKTTFVSHPFYPCEFIEELDKYYDTATHAPKGNNTPCYL